MQTIFIVSDGTGMTAEQVVQAALTQFAGADVRLVRQSQIKTPEAVRAVVEWASQKDALIVHTLVSADLRRLMLEEARFHTVDAMDLMGPMLERLSTHLARSPKEEPGLYSQIREERTRRIEAVEYAIRHDDGKHIEELTNAEIVLVGVSRTMKTPTSIYLAYRGWFVGNVPIVPEIPLNKTLLKLPHDQIYGLTGTTEYLVDLRRSRARHLGMDEDADYFGYEKVHQEIQHARHLCAQNRWRVINVTGKSVEEVASEVLTLIRRNTGGKV